MLNNSGLISLRRLFNLSVPLCFLLLIHLAVIYISIMYVQATHAQNKTPTPFDELTQKIWATPYTTLPQYKVSAKRFGSKKKNSANHLYTAATRTLNDTRSWLTEATEPKLFNANGICFKGTWLINQETPYNGAFQKGTHVNVIARASVALSGTKQKDKRSFGIAIKVFGKNNQQSANAFTMHSLAGTKTNAVLNLTLDNEPALKGVPPLSKIRTLLRIDKDLKRADKDTGTQHPKVNYRPLHTLAHLDTTDTSVLNTHAPTWMRLTPITKPNINRSNDFREELTLNAEQPNIEYRIDAATGDVGKKKHAQWKEIGLLVLNDSVISKGCDVNLHFTHPKRVN